MTEVESIMKFSETIGKALREYDRAKDLERATQLTPEERAILEPAQARLERRRKEAGIEMPDHGWKQFERRIAESFGGKRRGAHTSDGGSGLSDVIHDHWSIECKLLGRPSFQQMLDAARQAEAAASENQEPVAVVKKKGQHDDNALVVMRLETFKRWRV